jgi:hypothetical protein
MEYLYNQFIPICLVVGKNDYNKIGLARLGDSMQEFHSMYCRCCVLTILTLCMRDMMANWALDALIELLQHKYKVMQFPNSIEGWQSHSGNMPLVSHCQNFLDLEYTHRFNAKVVDAKFIDGVLDEGELAEFGNNVKR